MITIKDDNLFDSTRDIIVNPVNCRYGAGGLAKAFKLRFPLMWEFYKNSCSTGQLAMGKPVLYRYQYPMILLFPVKDDWREPVASLENIEKGLVATRSLLESEPGCLSIAFPALGCGLGQRTWDEVYPLMEKHLGALPNAIDIYRPK